MAATARDRLSDLPDNLLSDHILSKLSIRDAIRCSVLSQRWKLLWTLLPSLKFTRDFFPFRHGSKKDAAGEFSRLKKFTFEGVIDGIIVLHSVYLDVFELYDSRRCSSNKIYQWILCAASKGVREITLEEHREFGSAEVPVSLFFCDRLTSLSLVNFELKRIPESFGGFAHLVTFYVGEIGLYGDTFEVLVELCPVLENLRVRNCWGRGNLKIFSESLRSLSLEGIRFYRFHSSFRSKSQTITANCPQLVKIKIKDCWDLREMKMNFPQCTHLATSEYHLLEQFQSVTTLRRISFLSGNQPFSMRYLLKFPPCIEHICLAINDNYQEAIAGMTMPLESTRKIHVHICSSFSELMPFLGCLLESAPSLEKLTISKRMDMGLGDVRGMTNALDFVKGLMNLDRRFAERKFFLNQKNFGRVSCPNCDVLK